MKRRLLHLATLVLFVTGSDLTLPTVHAGGLGIFATEFTQILNNIQLLEQTLTQAQQLQTQFQQYETMLQNSLNIPNQVFSSINADLQSMASVVNNGQALAYSMANLDQQFTATYPGYQPKSQVPFPQQYQKWNTTTLATIQSTLKGAGLRGSQLQSEQAVLDSLKQMSQSNTGALEATQTGNQIATEQVAQLQKLQALMLTDMQSKNAYFASQTQSQINSDMVLQQMFTQTQFVGTGKTY